MSMLPCLPLLPLAVSTAFAADENAVSIASDDVVAAASDAEAAPDAAPSAEGDARAPAPLADAGSGTESIEGGPPPAPPGGAGPAGRGPRGGRRGGPRGGGGRGMAPPAPPAPEETIWSNIRPVGLLQLWGTVYDMDEAAVADATSYGDAEDDPGFKVKRLRLGLKSHEGGLDWALVLGTTAPYDGFDDADGELEIIDAHVGYAASGFGVKAGKDEVPFSRDRMISSGEQTFTERGMIAQHIAPGRELGASVFGEKAGAKITLGVFNSGGEDVTGDDNAGKLLLGRLEYAWGDADVYETWGGSEEFSFGVGAGGFLTDDVATSTRAFGADAMLRVAGLSVLLDGALAQASPTETTLDVPGVWDATTRRGVTAQVGYGVAAFEPAVKASLYEDSAVGGFTTVLGGLTWHGALDDDGRDRVRIGAGYELRLEGDPIANDTVRVWAQVRP